MLRQYFNCNERLEIFPTCFGDILCYVGRFATSWGIDFHTGVILHSDYSEQKEISKIQLNCNKIFHEFRTCLFHLKFLQPLVSQMKWSFQIADVIEIPAVWILTDNRVVHFSPSDSQVRRVTLFPIRCGVFRECQVAPNRSSRYRNREEGEGSTG